MSIDYKNRQYHRVVVSSTTADDVEFELWSKSFQWRPIGFDVKVKTAPVSGMTLKLRNDTQSVDLVSQDIGTSAIGTTFEVRVPADADEVAAPGDIVQLISTETEATGVLDVTVIATATDS